MYEKYMIVEETLRNVKKGGKLIGFLIGIRLPYYRGVVLSLVGETEISVDGEKIPNENIVLALGSKTYHLDRLVDEPVDKWEFGEIGILTVAKPGGVTSGNHRIDYRQHLKISYVLGGFWGEDHKTVMLGE